MRLHGVNPIRFVFLGAPLIAILWMTSGCGMAQQAELKDVERNLGNKIAKLDQRDRELQQTVKQAKVDIDKLVSETRARLSQEITALREEELPALRGGLDKDSHQMSALRSRVDDLERQLRNQGPAYTLEKTSSVDGPTLKTLQGRLDAQETVLNDLLRQVMSLKQAIERDKR